MRHLKTTLAVLGAVTILVLAGNTISIAATGHGLLLGKVNSADKVTTLKRTTSGAALKVVTKKPANPPFAVNGKGRVANLNADKVDGLDSSVLANRTRIYEAFPDTDAPNNGFKFNTPTIPAGTYLVSVSGWIYGPNAPTTNFIACHAYVADPSRYLEQVMQVNTLGSTSGYYSLQINGSMRLATAQTIAVECSGPTGSYSTYVQDPIRINLTKIGQVTTGSLAAARLSPRARR